MKKFNSNNLNYLWTRSLNVIKNDGLTTFVKKLFNFIFSSNKIDLDAFEIRKDSTLDDFFIKFGSDKGSLDSKKTYDTLYKNSKEQKFKNYLDWINRKNPKDYDYQLGHDSSPIYDKFFSKRRLEKLKILEIGVANGHSIASWHHYFPNSNIYGIDNKKPYKFFYKSKRVKYFEIDIFEKEKIKKFIKQHGKFDFIIEKINILLIISLYLIFFLNLNKFIIDQSFLYLLFLVILCIKLRFYDKKKFNIFSN